MHVMPVQVKVVSVSDASTLVLLPVLTAHRYCSRDLDLMREPDIVNLDVDEEWLCPECTAPYSKDAIESELVA
jgi:hypothetical protein